MHDKRLHRLATLLGAGFLLASCAHEPPAARNNAGVVLAGDPNQVGLIFFSSPKCFTQPFGCGLGGQLGGADAQSRLLKEKNKVSATLAFWGGTMFACDKGTNPDRASELAEAIGAMPIAFVAPSGDDMKLPLSDLRRLKIATGKRWVVSNYVGTTKDLPWDPYLDLTVGQGKFRVFNFANPSPVLGKSAKNHLSPDFKLVDRLLGATPADRVNLVVVSSKNHEWFKKIVDHKQAHLVFETEQQLGETYAPFMLPWDRIVTSVRPRGQAAIVITLKAEPTFKGFYYAPVADAVRLDRMLGKPASEDHLSSEKVPGLWELTGELALLPNP